MRHDSLNEIDLSAQLRELQRQVAELRDLLVGRTAKQAKSSQADPAWRLVIPISEGKLVLGTWQRVFHLECDVRPRDRKVVVTVYGEAVSNWS